MKLTTRSVVMRHTTILFGNDGFMFLASRLKEQRKQGYRTFLLADHHTETYCLPLLTGLVENLRPDAVLRIRPGEESKTIETASRLWQELAANGADRHSLLVCLGGGVVTDLGGFTASCFKRGIRVIHVPTTLMAMADAAIGGKTAVNLGPVKNQVGTFCLPEAVIIHPLFLATLPSEHVASGLAEVVKTALVADGRSWNRIRAKEAKEWITLSPEDPAWMQMVKHTAAVKNRIVRIDFEEKSLRMLLNFGHTFGHAFESLAMQKGTPVSHGEAVALGMVCETWLSVQKFGLPIQAMQEITAWLTAGYSGFSLQESDIGEISRLILHDKKSAGGEIRFTGLSMPGQGRINGRLKPEEIDSAVRFYMGRGA